MIVFCLIVSAILLSANAFVCATFGHFFGLGGWMIWQAAPGLLALAFVFATILRFRLAHPALTIIYLFSAAWLGFLNFASFAALGCWVLRGIIVLSGWSPPGPVVAGPLFGLALAAAVYGLINARRIRITRVTVRLRNLPKLWRGRTAALVTDLHLGPLLGAGFLHRVMGHLNQVEPDVVFVSGDMFDGSTIGMDQLIAPWREVTSRKPVYFVTGNHDEFGDRNVFLDVIEGAGIHVLNNEKTILDGLQIVGVLDEEGDDPLKLRGILRRAQIDRSSPCILLNHRPVNLQVTEDAGISLQVSGHTHGGQMWPWNLLVARIYRGFASGLHRLNKLQVLTSNGVGTWGPPLRVGTKSEIVLIRFED